MDHHKGRNPGSEENTTIDLKLALLCWRICSTASGNQKKSEDDERNHRQRGVQKTCASVACAVACPSAEFVAFSHADRFRLAQIIRKVAALA